MFSLSRALKKLLPAAALLAFCAVPAAADTVTFTGTLSPSLPTFNRPAANGSGLTGQVVPYTVVQFTVSTAGLYVLQSIPQTCFTPGPAPCYNAAVRLYANSFDPSSPLTNLIPAGNIEGFGPTGAGAILQPNTTYFFVTTSIGNPFLLTGQPSFSNSITGPGTITLGAPAAVPEPATLLLLGTGLAGALGAARRGRRAAKEKI